MKKFISDVWTVQLPDRDIHIDSSIDESEIQNFVKGKGIWGENALYMKGKETFSVFDDPGEADNFINYPKAFDDSLTKLLNESTTQQELNGIMAYVNTYKNGMVVTQGHTTIPIELSDDQVVDIARVLDSDYDTLSETEQEEIRAKALQVHTYMVENL